MDLDDGFAQVTYTHRVVGRNQEIACVWGHTWPGDTTVQLPTEQDLFQLWHANFSPVVSQEIQFTGVKINVGVAGPDSQRFYSPPAPATGAIGGDHAPEVCCTLLHKKTNLPGRRGSGRCFLPPGSDASYNGAMVEPDMLAACNAAAASWLNACTTSNLEPVLLHSGGTTLGPSIITSITTDPMIGAQRRRLGR